MDNLFILIANNSQHAEISFRGKSQADVLEKFDNEYERKGFRIRIETPYGDIKEIKKTYR